MTLLNLTLHYSDHHKGYIQEEDGEIVMVELHCNKHLYYISDNRWWTIVYNLSFNNLSTHKGHERNDSQ